MKLFAILNVVIVCAFLSVSSGTILAQGSCGLPLPCENTTASPQNAFAINNDGTGRAGYFTTTDPTSTRPALEARSGSTADNAVGIFGRVVSPDPGHNSAGVKGTNNETTGDPTAVRLGVWGQANAVAGVGVLGSTVEGTGVTGMSSSGRGMTAISQTGIGLFSETTGAAGGIAVWGRSNTRAVVGTQGPTSCAGTYAVGACATTGDGVVARAGTGTAGNGVVATADSGRAVWGNSATGIGVIGNSGTTRAVIGTLGGTSCAGTYAVGGCGANLGDGVVGKSVTGRAGYFEGNVVITGSLTKGSGTFKIDHPVDPTNKYLSHSFVESPDMLSIYTGNVVLDAQGVARVTLPDWFEALNREFRYQLTSIGAPGPGLYIAEEISQHAFKIAGGQPGSKVSWQVTGIRHDPFAQKNRTPVEEWKSAAERGKYLHPAAYGQPEEMGVNYVHEQPLTPPSNVSQSGAPATASRVAQERSR